MKYYLADINEEQGGFEYCTTIRFQIEDDASPFEKRYEIASHWYTDMELDHDHLGDFWWVEGVNIVREGKLSEIDKATYDGMAYHLFSHTDDL